MFVFFLNSVFSEVQGDQRRNIYEALTQWNILDKDMVKVHGF
jgi:hypothetical protein